MNSLLRRFAATLVLLCAALVTLALPGASAHEGEGILEVESRSADGGSRVPYVVRLTWTNDGHPAVDATVTATPIDPSGAPQTPVPMEFQGAGGRYAGTIEFPSDGTWTVRFTSVTPAATLEIVEEVVAPPTTTTTTEAGEAADPSESTSATIDEASAVAEPEADEGGLNGLVVAVVIAGLAVVAMALVVRARRGTTTR